MLPFSRWRAGHLLAAWTAWWILLTLWALRDAIPLLWRLSRPGRHGNAAADFDGGTFTLSISEGTTRVWSGSVGAGELLLWLVLPPLILLLLWIAMGRRARADAPSRDRVAR
jgi:hypothetical protein